MHFESPSGATRKSTSDWPGHFICEDGTAIRSARNVVERALERAGITIGDVTLHTRHTALSRMIAAGMDDYTVMAISGHSSTRMLERTRIRPTSGKRARDVLSSVVTKWSQRSRTTVDDLSE